MDILTYIICAVGVYLMGWVHHCQEVDRYMNELEMDAKLDDFHRTEENIRELHRKGRVLNDHKEGE